MIVVAEDGYDDSLKYSQKSNDNGAKKLYAATTPKLDSHQVSFATQFGSYVQVSAMDFYAALGYDELKGLWTIAMMKMDNDSDEP
ncbi:unnamed protein product [Ilex paraguariensis]|uniref:Uncharacterized protein n=1 Tax=Ilex paraguariensis TaxID=185542 RepID=A0ABC8QQU5_9AQUA